MNDVYDYIIETIEHTGMVSRDEYHIDRVAAELTKFAKACSIDYREVTEEEFWVICEVHAKAPVHA